MNRLLRVRLGALYTPFERECARCDLTIPQALACLVNAALEHRLPLEQPPAARVCSVTFDSVEGKERFRALAREQGTTANRLLVRLVGQLLSSEQGLEALTPGLAVSARDRLPPASQGSHRIASGAHALSRGGPQAVMPVPYRVDSQRVHVTVRLSGSEFELLTRCATDNGFRSVPRLMVAIIRAYFTHGDVIGAAAAAELGQRNLHLLRINAQLRELLEQPPSPVYVVPVDQALKDLRVQLDDHVDHVSQVLIQARARWRLKPVAAQGAVLDH